MTRQTAPKPIATADIAWEEWNDVPLVEARFKHLSSTALGEDYHVGVAIEELPPGKQSAPAHYHMLEEEHVFMLEGRLTVRIGAERFPMQAGDYVCFPAGQKAGHCLINDSDAPCRYVIIGERKRDEVCVYPDSNKVLVRSLGRRALFDMGGLRSYWDGEATGLPAGQKPLSDGALDPLETPNPKRPIASDSVAWEPTKTGGEFGGRAKHLTYAAVGAGYHVGVLIESPAPGKRLCPTHYHMLEEEHAFVLEGELTLILGDGSNPDRRIPMRAGDYACFPAGLKVGHSLMNTGPGPCRTLTIGERNPNEVCVYPDSKKLAVDALRSDDNIFDMTGLRKYWDGERTT